MVTHVVAVGWSSDCSPSRSTTDRSARRPNWTALSCCATTESTSTLMRLNSSRHPHAPAAAMPRKMRPIAAALWLCVQLKMTQCLANALARSFTVSVLPTPAGPVAAIPSLRASACVVVSVTRSVSGVITNRWVHPRYSYPYAKDACSCAMETAEAFTAPSAPATAPRLDTSPATRSLATDALPWPRKTSAPTACPRAWVSMMGRFLGARIASFVGLEVSFLASPAPCGGAGFREPMGRSSSVPTATSSSASGAGPI
mmetsp:Transcript_26031/g.76312  ORF Transcript_26031/g.76312 Transcript_26031/m.76312 type:complete len:257 (+) Transcript_26031:2191-2961(+)